MTLSPVFEVPWERSGARYAGLPILPHGTERHPVPGGGSRTLAVAEGDDILLLDRDGGQCAELVLFDPDGRARAGYLSGTPRSPKGLMAMLSADTASAHRLRRTLERAGYDLGRAEAIRVLGDGSRPGDMVRLTCASAGLLVVAAPGGPMAPDAQDAPGEIILYVKRATPGAIKGGHALPDPLADPIVDLNIQPGDGRAYEVKKGQYIQIQDIQGLECSDFQCLSLRDLDAGLDREIDPMATRSMTGRLYPKPGLQSKFYSRDMTPLVEVVRDTCGRHDTFNVACTEKFYADLGYPGHLSCTGNINRDLARWGIAPRGGWPAINFFFNTMLDDDHGIYLDEPWSKPGDYVLLRAMTDLVCVSTACPSDVDATNGWNPTDIQVRTYSEVERFRPSIGWRKRPEDPLMDTRDTGFHASFAPHTREHSEMAGYWLPETMRDQGVVGEYWACRDKAALMDLSQLRKVEILGPDAEALLDLCLTRDVTRLAVGQVTYSALCNDHGGMIDDGTLFRLGEDLFRWVCGSDRSIDWLRAQAADRKMTVLLRDSTEQLCNIAVQGPLSRDVLTDLFWTAETRTPVEDLRRFRFTIARLGTPEGAACILSRTGFTGELGYELFCHPKDAAAVFDAIWDKGAPLGLAPIGLKALDMLRIEAGLPWAGAEFCDQTDPFEAGIGFAVGLKTKAQFIGRAALEDRKAHPQRRLVGLAFDGNTVPVAGDPVWDGRIQVGEITSATRSPILRQTIALARVAIPSAGLGTALTTGKPGGTEKRLTARVTAPNAFDPDRNRVEGRYAP